MPNAWFDSGLSGRRWPLHLKPYHDELLSSWVVRLSRAYGMEAGRFCVSVWRHSTFWSRDIDKGIYPEVLEGLIDRTATPLPRVFNTTFWGYRSFPAWDLYDNGVSPWLLSIGLRGRRRHRPWLQYCPSCLYDDDDPYFRRQWRLMFVTVCPRHRCQLLDRCVAWSAPCNIDQVPSAAEAITHCYRCQFDVRRAQAPTLDNTAGHHCLMQLQTLLIGACTGDCIPSLEPSWFPQRSSCPCCVTLGACWAPGNIRESFAAGYAERWVSRISSHPFPRHKVGPLRCSRSGTVSG